jgi:hypothetical protein
MSLIPVLYREDDGERTKKASRTNHMIKGDKMRNELDDGRKSYNIKYTHNLSQYSVSPSAISQGHSVHSIPVVLPWNSNDTSAVTSDRINNTHSPTNEEIMF